MSIASNGYTSARIDGDRVPLSLDWASQAGVSNLLLCHPTIVTIDWSLQKGS